MNIIPEWMSNVHPLIVHFPIALLVIAVLADFLSLVLKRYEWIKSTALALYVFGALGTVGAYVTGKQAADIVNFPAPSYPVISRHADLALYTMLFFGIYALIRLLFTWRQWDRRPLIAIILFIVAATGLGLVQQTAERGGELVFRYGVGTKVQPEEKQKQAQTTPTAKIEISESGSWQWLAGNNPALTVRNNFRLLRGSWDDLTLQAVKSTGGTKALSIRTNRDQAYLFAFGPALKNVQLSSQVNVDNLTGRFLLVHHVSAPDTYDFLVIDQGKIRLGRTVNGVLEFFDEGVVKASGWITLKVVGSSGHFRGYVNDKLAVHGHGADLPAGQAGFALVGSGEVQLTAIEATSLDQQAPMTNMKEQNMSHDSPQSGHTH